MQPLSTNYRKNVNMNVKWKWFPNLSVWNNSKWADIPLINQSTNETEFNTVVNQRKNEDHPVYSIVILGQNSEKRPGDLMRFAVA